MHYKRVIQVKLGVDRFAAQNLHGQKSGLFGHLFLKMKKQ
jgi:hypothetical protein